LTTTTESLPLIVGLPGTTLDSRQLEVLQKVRPAGLILFARNVESPDQVRRLVADCREIEPRPFLSIDLEGGMVNRLTRLWGELPSPSMAGTAGRRAVRALGEAAGAACRNLGVHLDLAPVVDLDRTDGLISAQERCFSDDPERVVVLARLFREGLNVWGVEGCLKHFPGLGDVPLDTHEELPTLGIEGRDPHLQVFVSLSADIPIVMVGHAVAPGLGDGLRPASLSRPVIDQATSLPGSPVILTDDVEMGALADWGDLPERVLEALRAHNHGVLVCKAFDRLEEIAERIEEAAASDQSFGSRYKDAVARLGTLQRDLCQRSAAVPAPDDATVAQLWDAARRGASP
jgi:beta-N-acetylhexosaminidase